MLTGLIAVGSFLVSFALTASVRRYAVRHALVDVPNARSSHTAPTPRGGGLAIALSWFSALAVLLIVGRIEFWVGTALLGGGAVVSAIGWLDDRYRVPAWVRALTHTAAAVWAVWCLGGLGSIRVGTETVWFGWLGSALAVVGLVWLTNLYNFMDGIDGLAAGEAVVAGVIGGALTASAGAPGVALAAFALAGAAGGLLVFNWPPATIFMGDVGSGLLGFAFGVMALASERASAAPLVIWILLLGVFVVDATATLARRVARGERWYEAHRSHAYQRAVQAGRSHRTVTVAALSLSVGLGAAGTVLLVVPGPTPYVIAVIVALLGALWFAVQRDRTEPEPISD